MPVIVNGRLRRVEPYRGYCARDEHLEFTPSREWKETEKAGARIDAQALTEIWLTEYARRLAIENAEIEHRAFIKEQEKNRLVRRGLETARYEDQREDRPRMSRAKLVRLLLQEQHAVHLMMDDAKAKRPMDEAMLAKWRRTVIGRGGGGFRIVNKVAIHDELTDRVHGAPWPLQARKAMRAMLEKVNDRIADPTIPTAYLAASIHGEIVVLHPWTDGNGRVSRLAAAYTFLVRAQKPPVIFGVSDGVDAPLPTASRCAKKTRTRCAVRGQGERPLHRLRIWVRSTTASGPRGAGPSRCCRGIVDRRRWRFSPMIAKPRNCTARRFGSTSRSSACTGHGNGVGAGWR